uniref:Thionin Osthi1-like n=1 Tax=Oryza sativa subsp. japonica TaxID=39947 RepID=Q5Z4S0_ORYSJ|nr:thionin Osthi1-like [Oryza sativa Japonica Group]
MGPTPTPAGDKAEPFSRLLLSLCGSGGREESEVVDFCKLGCASSVCSTMSTLFANEEANHAVDRCNEACRRFCTKEAETVTVVS